MPRSRYRVAGRRNAHLKPAGWIAKIAIAVVAALGGGVLGVFAALWLIGYGGGSSDSRPYEILVAICGLLGTVGGALFAVHHLRHPDEPVETRENS